MKLLSHEIASLEEFLFGVLSSYSISLKYFDSQVKKQGPQ